MSTVASPLRTTRPRVAPRGTAQATHSSDYAELSRRIREAGLLERRYGRYLLRTVMLALALVAGIAAVLLLGRSWWQIAVAVGFGAVFAQAGFLAHDGAHRQIFVSGRRNEWFSLIVTNLVVGLGYGWWMHKHTRHHGNPNTIGKDLDLDPNLIVFTPEDAAAARRPGLRGLVLRHQGWILLPALALTGLDLHVKTVRMLARPGAAHRGAEIALLVVRLVGFPALLICSAGPAIGVTALVVQLLTFGLLLGGAFAPNHIGMPLIGAGQRVDYLRRQVLTSRNIVGGPVIDVLMGGLNHQIEHHLFPSMPSANLRRGRAMIRRYCDELGIPYLERGPVGAMRDVVRSVHRLGIRHADPFDCPAAAALRLAS